jgi:hypothetical protein
MSVQVNSNVELLGEKFSTEYDACCEWCTRVTLEKYHVVRTDGKTNQTVSDKEFYIVSSTTRHFNGVETNWRLDDEERFDSLSDAEEYFNNY